MLGGCMCGGSSTVLTAVPRWLLARGPWRFGARLLLFLVPWLLAVPQEMPRGVGRRPTIRVCLCPGVCSSAAGCLPVVGVPWVGQEGP
jgi:hypothetical protein